jgi:antitoxin component of MazEF toxin-antitoxin module
METRGGWSDHIEAVRENKCKLDDLLKGITKDNLHSEIDFGRPEGSEIW